MWYGKPIMCTEYFFDIRRFQLSFFWLYNMSSYQINWTAPQIYKDSKSGEALPRGVFLRLDEAFDCRFEKLENGNMGVAYNFQSTHTIFPSYSEISLTAQRELTVARTVRRLALPRGHSVAPEKNWTPFSFNSSLLFIQSINPLHVVQLDLDREVNPDIDAAHVANAHVRFVSRAEQVNVRWDYGSHLRGGTNALLLRGDGQPVATTTTDSTTTSTATSTSSTTTSVACDDGSFYLSFFHTLTKLRRAGNRETYFMGAFTFTACPPFRLLRVSPAPILSDGFYLTGWYKLHQRNVDYVVYPTQITPGERGELLLTLGHNDIRAYAAKLRMDALLESLVPVI